MSNIYEEYEPYYCNNIIPRCGLKPILINTETREIINKDDIFAFGILMKRKYAEAFIKRGTIKFGCPKDWIDYAAGHKPGKGDIQEGVFAAYDLNNTQGIAKALNDNPNSYHIRLVSSKSDQVYLIDRNVITLPTYCFYVIKNGDYEIVRYGSSEYTAHLHISSRYIRGMTNGKSWEDSTKDNPDDQSVFVFIYDHDLFLEKIYTKLIEIGLTKQEILYKHIQYKNIDEPFEQEVEHPFELFIKNKQFYDQHEGRIVLNTSDPVLKEFFHNNTIDIGSLEDICVLFNQYPAGGIEQFIDLNV